jgi:hypothetical protein
VSRHQLGDVLVGDFVEGDVERRRDGRQAPERVAELGDDLLLLERLPLEPVRPDECEDFTCFLGETRCRIEQPVTVSERAICRARGGGLVVGERHRFVLAGLASTLR